MAGEKQMTEPWLWKRTFTAGANGAYTGPLNEMVIDYTDTAAPVIHIHDGSTPGGQAITSSILTGVAPPKVTVPVNGALNVVPSPIITLSSFTGVDVNYNSDTQVAYRLVLALDVTFTNVVYDSGRTVSTSNTVDLGALGVTLNATTQYFARVSYEGSNGVVSEFGPVTSFTVEALDITGTVGTLVPSTPSLGGQYGNATAISGNGVYAAVGMYLDDTLGLDSGAVFLYEQVAGIWVEKEKLMHPLGQASAYFGCDVSLNETGDVLTVGAYGNSNVNNVVGAGAVHVYKRTGSVWTLDTSLVPLDHTDIGWFGYSVSVNTAGNCVVIGSPTKTVGVIPVTTAGYVYVFTKDALGVWTQTAGIAPPVAIADGYFGHAVDVDGLANNLVVGSPYDSTAGVGAGKAEVYTLAAGAWSLTSELTDLSVTANDHFGFAVSISNDGLTCAIGANADDATLAGAGGVYIYSNTTSVWTAVTKIEAPTVELGANFGTSVALSGDGLTLLVGAPFQDNAAVETGMVLVYLNTASVWGNTASIVSASSLSGDSFGHDVSVDLSGIRGLAGSTGNDAAGLNTGLVHVLG